MKFAYTILSVAALSVLLAGSPTSAIAQPKTAVADQSSTAITREAAEQLIMKKYLGAKIVHCDLQTKDGNSVWVVKFTRTGANLAENATVDAHTGKITRGK